MAASNLVRLGDCTQGRESSQIKQLSDAVIAFARDKHGMRLTYTGRDQNYINFAQDDTFAINKVVTDGLSKRFPGCLLRGKTWSVPIDRTLISGGRERSESPSRSTVSESRYHLKMIIVYTWAIAVIIALKLV
jgi:hypothetical protein